MIQNPLFRKSLVIVLFLLAGQVVALGGEVAVLRNGFSIRHDRREQRGDVTRLYTAEGYIDIPTDQIASFEVDEIPQQPVPEQASVLPVSQPAVQAPPTKVDVNEVVREASARRQLDPDFVNSVIKAESNFHPRAVSPKGAQGLMQLMPETAAKLGVRDPFDPKANVEAGTTYLSDLMYLYHDDPIKALAAYNAGPQRVEQYHGVPPYTETRLYIARVVRDFNAKKARQKAPATGTQVTQKKKVGAKATVRKVAGGGKSKDSAREQQASLSASSSVDAK